MSQLPAATQNACADGASRCFAAASDLNGVTGCFDELVSCATRSTAPASPGTGAPQTCQQKWIACFGGDILKLFECAGTLADCKD